MIAHNPLHGSGQAGFPHPALALGDDAHAAQGIGMTDGRRRQPASDEAPHAIPKDAAVLAAPRKRAMPEPSHLEPKNPQRILVQGHSVVLDVSTHHRLQPFALFGDGFVHPPLKFGFHLVQLRLQSFADRLPQHREPSIAPLLHADVRKAKKVERFRFPFSTPLPLVDRKRTKFQQARFLGMQFQVELSHSFRKFRPELFGIRFAVKAHHDVVRVSHHDDLAVRALPTPCLDPQIKYVMKIDVRQKRRSTATLRRPFFHSYSFPILQHAGPQPFLDEPHDAPVCNPVLDELHKPFVRKSIEKALDVQIKHPVHFSRQQSRIERIQRLMLAAPWSEPVRKSKKVGFIDSVQHLDRRALDNFVFQRRYSERSLPPVGLRDKHSTHRLRSVCSPLQPFGKVLEIVFQFLPVVPPRLPVHARRSFPLQAEVGHAQRFQVVDVVQERREPQLLILSCCLTYPLQRTRRVHPARCPGRVLLWQVPFGQTASLHPLRHRLPSFVRGLLRCRVGGGAPSRWPPSAAQSARADFPHAAFTKTRASGMQEKGNISVDPTRICPVGSGRQYPRMMMYGYFAKRTDPPQHPYSSGCSSLPSGLRLPPSPTHSSRRSLGHTAFTVLQVIFGSPTTVRASLAISLPLIGSLTPVSPEDSASPPEVTRCSSVPCRPQTPWCDGVNENAFVSIVQTRPYPTFGRPVHLRGSPHRLRPGTSPHALRIPSRDGHPALRRTASDGFRYALAVSGFRLRARLGVTIPFALPGQRGVTPAFGYSAPHSSARGTLTLLNNALRSAHYWAVRLLTKRRS